MPHQLYTIGYSGSSLDDLQRFAEALDAVIFDIRFSPRSRNPYFRGAVLRQALGHRYSHVKALGNRNYKGGPIDLVDPEAGIQAVREALEHESVILMCMCARVDECHRSHAALLIESALGIEAIHLPPRFETFVRAQARASQTDLF